MRRSFLVNPDIKIVQETKFLFLVPENMSCAQSISPQEAYEFINLLQRKMLLERPVVFMQAWTCWRGSDSLSSLRIEACESGMELRPICWVILKLKVGSFCRHCFRLLTIWSLFMLNWVEGWKLAYLRLGGISTKSRFLLIIIIVFSYNEIHSTNI